MLRAVFLFFLGCTVASRGGYQMARGRHYAKLSLSNAARLSFSDLCILLFMFLSLCRLCVCVFLCSHWSLVDVPLIFFCPADHVPDWQPRVLLGMVEARSVNVKKTTTTTTLVFTDNEWTPHRNSGEISYACTRFSLEYGDGPADARWDCRTRLARPKILRRERGQGIIHFPCSAS